MLHPLLRQMLQARRRWWTSSNMPKPKSSGPPASGTGLIDWQLIRSGHGGFVRRITGVSPSIVRKRIFFGRLGAERGTRSRGLVKWLLGFSWSVSEENEFLSHSVEGAAGFRQRFGKRAQQMARRVGRCIGIIGRSTERLAGE